MRECRLKGSYGWERDRRCCRLTVVATEGEAAALWQMLRLEGIRCADRVADTYGEGGSLEFGAWREILVSATDLVRARELLPPS